MSLLPSTILAIKSYAWMLLWGDMVWIFLIGLIYFEILKPKTPIRPFDSLMFFVAPLNVMIIYDILFEYFKGRLSPNEFDFFNYGRLGPVVICFGCLMVFGFRMAKIRRDLAQLESLKVREELAAPFK